MKEYKVYIGGKLAEEWQPAEKRVAIDPDEFELIEGPVDNTVTTNSDDWLYQKFQTDECWNLDVTIAQFILPRLKVFKSQNNGYPNGLTEAKWDKILDQMIAAFEILANTEDAYDFFAMPNEERQEKIKIVNTGLRLFAKYYMALWW